MQDGWRDAPLPAVKHAGPCESAQGNSAQGDEELREGFGLDKFLRGRMHPQPRAGAVKFGRAFEVCAAFGDPDGQVGGPVFRQQGAEAGEGLRDFRWRLVAVVVEGVCFIQRSM